MERSIDFYLLGQTFAKETIDVLIKKATEIKEQYGKEAKEEFELGIASAISDYEYVDQFYEESIDYEHITGTLNFGIQNTRNNSYFNETGTSKQYIYGPDNKAKYNEPKKRR